MKKKSGKRKKVNKYEEKLCEKLKTYEKEI